MKKPANPHNSHTKVSTSGRAPDTCRLNRRQVMQYGSVVVAGAVVQLETAAAHARRAPVPQPGLREEERAFLIAWVAGCESDFTLQYLRPRQVYCGNIASLAWAYNIERYTDEVQAFGREKKQAADIAWPWKSRQDLEDRLSAARARVRRQRGLKPDHLLIEEVAKIGIREDEARFLMRYALEWDDEHGCYCRNWSLLADNERRRHELYPASVLVERMFGEDTEGIGDFSIVLTGIGNIRYQQKGLVSATYAAIKCPWISKQACFERAREVCTQNLLEKAKATIKENNKRRVREDGYPQIADRV